MIKYTVRFGDSSEEFEFEHVDELLKYLDYKKYDVKMDGDFYPDDELDMKPEDVVQDDWSSFERKTDKDILKEAFDKIGVGYEMDEAVNNHFSWIRLKDDDCDGDSVDFNFGNEGQFDGWEIV